MILDTVEGVSGYAGLYTGAHITRMRHSNALRKRVWMVSLIDNEIYPPQQIPQSSPAHYNETCPQVLPKSVLKEVNRVIKRGKKLYLSEKK